MVKFKGAGDGNSRVKPNLLSFKKLEVEVQEKKQFKETGGGDSNYLIQESWRRKLQSKIPTIQFKGDGGGNSRVKLQLLSQRWNFNRFF